MAYDAVCLNCIHWKVNSQMRCPAEGVICTKGRGHTNPDDACNYFTLNRTVDETGYL